ncbi:MAG: hypothetical protein KGZ63_14115 [Clostridiales bacterium]|nr:hypothetical protein [Dethiobacter sp.]MBS4032538.1 hypothetical protein [Clostridiales bacterium]
MALKEKYEDQVVFVIVDVGDQEGNRMANEFMVRYIPAFFYIDSNGEIVANDTGVLTKGNIESRIAQILDN